MSWFVATFADIPGRRTGNAKRQDLERQRFGWSNDVARSILGQMR